MIKKTIDLRSATNDPTNLKAGASLFEQFGYKFKRKLVGTGDIDQHTNFEKIEIKSGINIPTEDNDFHIFRPDDPAHALINAWDLDAALYSGLEMRYYRVKPVEEQTYYNEVYRENSMIEYEGAILTRNSINVFLEETQPIVIWGFYEAEELTQDLGGYGLDSKQNAKFWFNRMYIEGLLNRNPVPGDLVLPFSLPERIYQVNSVIFDNYTLYFPRRYRLECELLQMSK